MTNQEKSIQMKIDMEIGLLLVLILFLFPSDTVSIQDSFLQCMSNRSSLPINVYSQSNTSYTKLLQSPIQNLRFLSPTTPKPLFLIAPTHDSHVQASIICCQKHKLQVRVRSGGHDYEGLSYISNDPYVIVDLFDMRSIEVDIREETVWIQAGATVGELYYRIAEKSKIHGFPAGVCPTVGVGGHFSGGGIGTLMRKYGLAADNVIDASFVDSRGRIFDRESMGEELFWAIRGGGASSFGVVISWKIRLVRVPPTVTVFSISSRIEQGATELVQKWENKINELHRDLFIRVIMQSADVDGEPTAVAIFNSLFLGSVDDLVNVMEESFPELGLKIDDCLQMSWIESILYFAVYPPGSTIDALLDREPPIAKTPFKAKSDFVTEPIPEKTWQGVWARLLQAPTGLMILDPLGGKMSEMSDSDTPFPYRGGYLYNIQYMVKWEEGSSEGSHKYLDWIDNLYEYMSPSVSKSPRGAYLNYRDLDLGQNEDNGTSFAKASEWGVKYFKRNFRMLAFVKTMIDPDNFFKDEQSIPPLTSSFMENESLDGETMVAVLGNFVPCFKTLPVYF